MLLPQDTVFVAAVYTIIDAHGIVWVPDTVTEWCDNEFLAVYTAQHQPGWPSQLSLTATVYHTMCITVQHMACHAMHFACDVAAPRVTARGLCL